MTRYLSPFHLLLCHNHQSWWISPILAPFSTRFLGFSFNLLPWRTLTLTSLTMSSILQARSSFTLMRILHWCLSLLCWTASITIPGLVRHAWVFFPWTSSSSLTEPFLLHRLMTGCILIGSDATRWCYLGSFDLWSLPLHKAFSRLRRRTMCGKSFINVLCKVTCFTSLISKKRSHPWSKVTSQSWSFSPNWRSFRMS